MILKDEHCTCRGEAHDECRPCADCDQTPATEDAADGPDGEVMWLCVDCHEWRVEAEEQRFQEQRELDITETYLRNE